MRRMIAVICMSALFALIVGAPILDYANVHGWLSKEWSQRLCFGQRECLKVVEKKTERP